MLFNPFLPDSATEHLSMRAQLCVLMVACAAAWGVFGLVAWGLFLVATLIL